MMGSNHPLASELSSMATESTALTRRAATTAGRGGRDKKKGGGFALARLSSGSAQSAHTAHTYIYIKKYMYFCVAVRK